MFYELVAVVGQRRRFLKIVWRELKMVDLLCSGRISSCYDLCVCIPSTATRSSLQLWCKHLKGMYDRCFGTLPVHPSSSMPTMTKLCSHRDSCSLRSCTGTPSPSARYTHTHTHCVIGADNVHDKDAEWICLVVSFPHVVSGCHV